MTASQTRSVEMTAWAVLLGALAVFLLLLFGVPYALAAFARTSTVAERAEVQVSAGSVTLESPVGETRVLSSGQRLRDVPEGTVIRTQAEARAYVRLFDDSVLQLGPDTAVALRRLRQPRFAAGGRQRDIALELSSTGAGDAGLALGSTFGDLRFEVATRLGTVALAPQSQAVLTLTSEALKVKGGEGTVTVTAGGRSVPLSYDQRTVVTAGQPPATPVKGPENVVKNSGFDADPSPEGPWHLDYYNPAPEESRVLGRAEQARTPEGRAVARFVRRDSHGSPGDLYYEQTLDADVGEATALNVTADLRVLFQDLAGGGSRLSEFPIMVTVIASDAEDNPIEWTTGFYARPPDADHPDTPRPGPPHQQVPEGEWYHFDSGNLLDPDNPNGFSQLGKPRPVRLKRVLVKASGHDYESEVDGVGVWVK